MQMKKIVSAAAAFLMAAGAISGTGLSLTAAAADPTLTFDIRSNGKNAVEIKGEDIAARDITVPVNIFIPSNPGVSGINLKLQVNDGEIADDGTFGNYGLYLTDGKLATPFCFDSASKGDASASFSSLFTDKMMNVSWVFSQETEKLPDAAAEPNTIQWDSSVNWAYENAFATANLVIPKGTAPGEYKLDVRKDAYVNALSTKYSEALKSRSKCFNAANNSEVSFESVPLTVKVDEVKQSAGWDESYEIEGAGHYMIIGDVSGKPGETVRVPVYVFNDNGTAGLQVFFEPAKDLELVSLNRPSKNSAYRTKGTPNSGKYPAYVFAQNYQSTAEDGTEVLELNYKIPEDAKEGTLYPIRFYHEGEHQGEVFEDDGKNPPPILKIVDIDGEKIDVAFYDGSITVVSDTKPVLNRTAATLPGPNEYCNLTLFNADGPVTWKSSAPEIATVDQNGFVKSVKYGSTKITATCGDQEYSCDVVVGMLGDVERNGDVTSADAQLVLIHYTEVFSGNEGRIPQELFPLADVNHDGEISVEDAQSILKYYVNNTVAGNQVTWEDVI